MTTQDIVTRGPVRIAFSVTMTREPDPLHETHVCRDCEAEITIPYPRDPSLADPTTHTDHSEED